MNSPTVTIRVEPKVLELMNRLVREGIFKSKSEILRKALLQFLSKYEKLDPIDLYLTVEP
ncbi:ribbon-helix-helix protein, CopG family [Candidatus Bathyarchaeota archaeon]|nr:ribbon-helix-helix protein, CopG family [Candidatus Bathyarchaeota archaeon]